MNNDEQKVNAEQGETPSKRSISRQHILGISALSLIVAGIAVYWGVSAQYQETTEDAFVDGNVVAVTAQVSGVVTGIAADNTDFVTAGFILVKLDDVDAHLARARAEAQLAKIVRQVRVQYANVGQTRATRRMRQVELERAKADLARRLQLEASGAISGEDVKHAQDAVRSATAALDAAGQQVVGSQALLEGTTIASNPDVLAAASQVRDAYIAERRTNVPAPVSGVVTKRNAQIGQKISAGSSLMSVVPLDHLWVTANFKESQLGHIRIGQPVTLTADVYGSEVTYKGIVIGQDAGTGSAFSLLPAQNATGNWVKVVQRVPVRIALDPKEVQLHPLQLGLSMKVKVETHQRSGGRLITSSAANHSYQTNVFADELASADDVVSKIIEANQ